MAQTIYEKALQHSIKHVYTGREHHYEVLSGTTRKKYNCSIKLSCDCAYSGIQGSVNGKPCSHLISILNCIALEDLRPNEEWNINNKRNDVLGLVRPSNRAIGYRTGQGEGIAHQEAKKLICQYLDSQEKKYVCEAIMPEIRADILVLDDAEVIEIAVTEKSQSLLKKKVAADKLGLKFRVIKIGRTNKESY